MVLYSLLERHLVNAITAGAVRDDRGVGSVRSGRVSWR